VATPTAEAALPRSAEARPPGTALGPRATGARATVARTGRPTPNDLAAAVATGKTVPDVVAIDLDVLFCGINPGRWSGAVGHHFAHPGNRFWKLLYAAGLTDEQLSPSDERRLLEVGLGVTNLVARTTASAAEVTTDELRRGAAQLARKADRWRPAVVAVLGLGAYRTAFGRPRASVGLQAEPLGPSALWVLPNPSGLQAHYRFEDMVEQLRALRAIAAARRGGPPSC
jgi:TDG/mug DNA glycosylase family protein